MCACVGLKILYSRCKHCSPRWGNLRYRKWKWLTQELLEELNPGLPTPLRTSAVGDRLEGRGKWGGGAAQSWIHCVYNFMAFLRQEKSQPRWINFPFLLWLVQQGWSNGPECVLRDPRLWDSGGLLLVTTYPLLAILCIALSLCLESFTALTDWGF